MKSRAEYWHKTRALTVTLLVLWIIVTFVISWFARELNTFTFFGFPFGFYMAAQGSLFLFLLMVWVYAVKMNRLDEEYGVED